MCVSIPQSAFAPTEDICNSCKPDEDGDTYHYDCEEYNYNPCACRNSDHKILTPQAMFEKMLAAMNIKKEEVSV